MIDLVVFYLLSTLYHSASGHIHVFPGFYQCQARALKCLAKALSHQNPMDTIKFKPRAFWKGVLFVGEGSLSHALSNSEKTFAHYL